MVPAVSVIIPTFNRAEFITEAVDSILAQTLAPLEVIVVNDGSTDDTMKVLAAYGDKVRVFEKENGGKSTALNLGLTYARGDYVWVFDDDDVALGDALERHFKVLSDHPEAEFSYSGWYWGHTGDDGRIVRDDLNEVPDYPADELFARLMDGCFIDHPAIVVKRTCYTPEIRFDERLVRSQDYDMLLRLARRHRAVRVDGPTYVSRKHAGARGSAKDRFAAKASGLRWLKYDRIIFDKLHRDLALHEYLPGRSVEPPLSDGERRECMIRRLSLMARRGLWDYAIPDIEPMLAIEDRPFTATEIDLFKRASDKHLSCRLLADDFGLLRGLKAACASARGGEIAFQISRGLFHRAAREVKDRDFVFAFKLGFASLYLIGWRGIRRRLTSGTAATGAADA